ncbi:MAG: GNAT family N-acetyltransferase [Desulfovibrionaceae bacterium]|nr:GNAT family N-acetyltransferase [Desulfovibrionaceae bacterium]
MPRGADQGGGAPLVRFATPGDLDALVGLLGELFAIEEDFSFDAGLQRRGLEMMLGGEDGRCVFVAEVAGAVAGMVTGQALVSTAEGGLSVLVEDMVVAAAHRGRGLGGRLMAAMERWAAAHGASRLQLAADKDNAPAFEFYGRLGWEPTNLVILRKKKPAGKP